MTEDIDKYLRYFLILSAFFIILFVIATFNISPYRSVFYLLGPWMFALIGFLFIIGSTIMVYHDLKEVNSIFIVYAVGIGLILLSVFIIMFYGVRPIGYILTIISLIGFIGALFLLNKVKSLFNSGIESSIASKRESLVEQREFLAKLEFPPILSKRMRYCENCQKFVRPYKLRLISYFFYICILCLPGIIFLIFLILIKKKNKCPTCRKVVSLRTPTPEEIENALFKRRQYILDKIAEVEDFKDFQPRVKAILKDVRLNLWPEGMEFLKTRNWTDATRREEYIAEIEAFLKMHIK
ncbi:MAG: Got1/Sft2-like family vesicle transport protein [Promethearchaeota archaeon]